MSLLLFTHARAARILAKSFETQAGPGKRDATGAIAAMMAAAYHDAADTMEELIKDEAAWAGNAE